MLCVEFSQVQYIDLGGIIHGLKAVTIVTSEFLNLYINHFWGLSHFLSDEVSPGWRPKPSLGTQKKCPFPLYKGVPSIEYNKYKDYVNIFSGPNFVSLEWSCPKGEVPLWTENWAHLSPSSSNQGWENGE